MTRRRYYSSTTTDVDAAALLVVGAVVIVGGVVVGLGVGCYYAGKGAWWLGKKGVHAVQSANEKRDQKNFAENLQHKQERRKMKGKTLEVQPKIPEAFSNLTAEESAKQMGVLTLRFGSCSNLKNLDTVGLSDPYAKIYFCDYEGTKVHYFKTYTIDESLNPVWDLDDITVHFFPGMQILIKVYDEDPGRDELEGICRVPLADLFATSQPAADFKSVTYALGGDEKHKRSNTVSQLINPSGISKQNVKGSVSFSFAFVTDEVLKKEGQEHLPEDTSHTL